MTSRAFITRPSRAFRLITQTVSGRLLTGAAAVKAVVLALQTMLGTSALLSGLDLLGTLGLVLGGIALVFRGWSTVRRVVLWRVRRKLILSYVFIGFVPALLIVCFFLIAGLLLFFTLGAYMVESRASALVAEARALAVTAAVEVAAPDAPPPSRVLAARLTTVVDRYASASAALVPGERCRQDPPGGAVAAPLSAGPWDHAAAPHTVPSWVPCDGLAVLTTVDRAGRVEVTARAVVPVGGSPPRMLIVDVPLGEDFSRQVYADTGIRPARVAAVRDDGAPGPPTPVNAGPPGSVNTSGSGADQGGLVQTSRFQWVAFLDAVDWETGRARGLLVPIGLDLPRVYRRLTGSALNRIGDVSFGQLLLIGLAVVGGLFLVIQAVAFVAGMILARSVTGAVHALFAGTERVRRGDFSHRIRVPSGDQLGELAESFNAMTASVEDLLKQKAEKERLEQELRVARRIQMSLLPQGALEARGVSLVGSCEPAREVGGDYYDFFPIDDDRVGLLIADVAGKGTSAALYMAELKGIVLSLSHSYHSPRRLLIEANRIVSLHFDSRSFITMTYGVVDRQAATFTHARAGHCPLIHLSCATGDRAPRVLAPGGLVLGLQLDAGEAFERLLEESTMPILPGDLFLLYTDGLSEAMNEDGDFFGDERLGEALSTHADGPFHEVGDRILADVRVFMGAAAQHDDMTLLMVKIAETGVEGLERA